MCSARDNAALPALGFPIRASAGHWPFSASPRLIAAVHALLRLLVPRHPPCALTILTVIWERALRLPPGDTRVIGCCAVFKVRKRQTRLRRPRATACGRRRRAGLSKLNSMRVASLTPGAARATCQIRSTLSSGRSLCRGLAGAWSSCASYSARPVPSRGLPRKEVIQPQLPLRLPCYDFTPVTSPTFDGSLPKGLGDRLRVLPAPMV
jgi:hypothetical protein